jgi:hypothetical protein
VAPTPTPTTPTGPTQMLSLHSPRLACGHDTYAPDFARRNLPCARLACDRPSGMQQPHGSPSPFLSFFVRGGACIPPPCCVYLYRVNDVALPLPSLTICTHNVDAPPSSPLSYYVHTMWMPLPALPSLTICTHSNTTRPSWHVTSPSVSPPSPLRPPPSLTQTIHKWWVESLCPMPGV